MLKEPGKAAKSKSYMWLYRTSGCAEYPIVLYEYQPNRKAEHAEEFLRDFSGWLHADGYQGYHKLPEKIRVVGCWTHARRKFDEALQTLPQEQRKNSLAATGEYYCSRLFQMETSFAELTPEERYEKRLELEKPVLDALLAWANETSGKTAPKSVLGRALHYLMEQWPYLICYLEDGRLELSNNRAERSIKPFVMGRKNWLFANTPGGAQASSMLYSLIETAKENGLDPYRYLLWILKNAPGLSRAEESWAKQLLPTNAPQECRMPQD
ncbi:IS66 family transposase ISCde1 [bioreactor metagenome]|uniref:IS66 family transposase ISCde1 n=1 Tax=bioreactor metagenome TaxID=1076179 RepID=A0A645FE86_9ZZZZ